MDIVDKRGRPYSVKNNLFRIQLFPKKSSSVANCQQNVWNLFSPRRFENTYICSWQTFRFIKSIAYANTYYLHNYRNRWLGFVRCFYAVKNLIPSIIKQNSIIVECVLKQVSIRPVSEKWSVIFGRRP